MDKKSTPTLAEIAAGIPGDYGTKPPGLWSIYESYLAPLRDRPLRVLELGIWKGVSLRVFSTYFPNASIVGLDIALPQPDPSTVPNVKMIEGSQHDTSLLARIGRDHAPNGWDIVIDDASHSGLFSLRSFEALFPALKIGGLYFVEDWGCAYMPTWGDGGTLEPPRPYDQNEHGFEKRIATHDYGMAGFVKVLVDKAHNCGPSIFDWLTLHDVVVVAKKR